VVFFVEDFLFSQTGFLVHSMGFLIDFVFLANEKRLKNSLISCRFFFGSLLLILGWVFDLRIITNVSRGSGYPTWSKSFLGPGRINGISQSSSEFTQVMSQLPVGKRYAEINGFGVETKACEEVNKGIPFSC